ncbi:MAG TPA: alpha/beta fold hydrolase [Gemmatimonadales bacterium]|jgi:YbgC/YbaW family acyl-CoA thioester hydrolase|nr:alpha/beta fold hydrolase [Gemmatimonadales bacterium]
MTPEIDLPVYPDECDAFGHLNQASFLSLFERARWEMLMRGPGMDVFSRSGAWPAVRKSVIDYHAAAFPGDVLRFHQSLIHLGRTSFTMRQTARRVKDDILIATAEFVFVCINRDGRPIPVPAEFAGYMGSGGDHADDARRFTVNGVTLAVEVRGDGPAVLFVHGYPFDRSIWSHQVAALDGYRRIAPDLRGMGASDAPDLGYSMEIYAADLAALLDVLAVEEVVLCGLSMGGYVAFECLRRWRQRVRGLVLMDTRAEADTAEGRKARDAAAALARDGGADAVTESLLPQVLGRSTRTGASITVERVRGMMSSTPVPGLVGALAAMRDRPDSSPLLAELAGVPTLVMVGEEDALTPPDVARAMADRIPGARLVTIPGSGHLPPVERPVETTRALLEFLRTLR